MLNRNWKNTNNERDLRILNKLISVYPSYKYQTENFFKFYGNEINYLYNTYFGTEKGGSVDPENRSVSSKFQILIKKDKRGYDTYDYLTEAMATEKEKEKEEWNKRQLETEPLDARLEREDTEWEARNSSIKLSKRDIS